MRLELTRKSDLALRAMRVLAARGERMKAAELAAEIGSTVGFTTQALNPLVRAGWVDSAVGPTGGYALTPAGTTVSVLQLLDAVEGVVGDGRCVLRDEPCPGARTCAVHSAWVPAREAMLQSLALTPVLGPAEAPAAADDDVLVA